MKIIKVKLLLLISIYPVFLIGEDIVGLSFLKIGGNAQQISLASIEAYNTRLYSVFSNPSFLKKNFFQITGSKWYNDTYYGTFSLSKQTSEKFNMGIGIKYINFGKIKRFNENGLQDDVDQFFGGYESTIEVSLKYDIFANLFLGIRGKEFIKSMDNKNSFYSIGDIGLTYLLKDKWAFSIMLLNIGIISNIIVPFNIIPGITYFISDSFILLGDIKYQPLNNYVSIGSGIDISFGEILFLKTGYRFSKDIFIKGLFSGFNCGAGIVIGAWCIDYSYSPSPLSDLHMVSLGIKY